MLQSYKCWICKVSINSHTCLVTVLTSGLLDLSRCWHCAPVFPHDKQSYFSWLLWQHCLKWFVSNTRTPNVNAMWSQMNNNGEQGAESLFLRCLCNCSEQWVNTFSLKRGWWRQDNTQLKQRTFYQQHISIYLGNNSTTAVAKYLQQWSQWSRCDVRTWNHATGNYTLF